MPEFRQKQNQPSWLISVVQVEYILPYKASLFRQFVCLSLCSCVGYPIPSFPIAICLTFSRSTLDVICDSYSLLSSRIVSSSDSRFATARILCVSSDFACRYPMQQKTRIADITARKHTNPAPMLVAAILFCCASLLIFLLYCIISALTGGVSCNFLAVLPYVYGCGA